ncbi:MAG TPA: ribbon-helix-helix domain-containing protein [Pseudonocardia sp.]
MRNDTQDGGVSQVAFQLDLARLAEIDVLVKEKVFRSRAEALRTAVDEFVARRREERIDAELAAGYGARPPGAEEQAWAELSVEGLRTADLEW